MKFSGNVWNGTKNNWLEIWVIHVVNNNRTKNDICVYPAAIDLISSLNNLTMLQLDNNIGGGGGDWDALAEVCTLQVPFYFIIMFSLLR